MNSITKFSSAALRGKSFESIKLKLSLFGIISFSYELFLAPIYKCLVQPKNAVASLAKYSMRG